MIHILDTDLFSLTKLPDSPEYLRLHSRVLQLSLDDSITTTIVTYEEQTRGWLGYAAKSRSIAHQINAYRRLKQHLLNYLQWTVLDFDSAAAAEFERLRTLKLRVGTSDLKIAAIALAHDALLLSRNLRDFTRIPGLRVADWSQP
jgi:tRNA(fMet)-specific endonuclease VapC